jgi:hypothetical protein
LVETSENKRLFGEKNRCMWKDNIKGDLKETGSKDVDFIHWTQDRDRRARFRCHRGGVLLDLAGNI